LNLFLFLSEVFANNDHKFKAVDSTRAYM